MKGKEHKADSERILQRPHTAYTIFKSAYNIYM